MLPSAQLYADSQNIALEKQVDLGWGTDGHLWNTTRPSVVKAHFRDRNFFDEVECYRRLAAASIVDICGLAVPELIGSDRSVRVVEISIVEPPCIIDFGKVYLDNPPDYWSEPQKVADWHAKGKLEFEDRWNDVLRICGFLKNKLGIHYIDPTPRNIMFE